MAQKLAPICEVFIDESSQNNHKYFVLGGIIVPIEAVAPMTARILAERLPHLPRGEMKWAKVSATKLVAYQRVVDLLFKGEFSGVAQYHCLVVDTHKLDHGAFNQGDREIGFNKEVFQLAMKFARLFGNRFHIYPDQRTTTQRPEDLRLMLNRAINKKEPKRDWPFRRVQFRDSAQTPILQVTDILTGAIAFCLNGHGKIIGASPAKVALSNHVLGRAAIKDPFHDTDRAATFTIWHRKLKVVP